jgi:5'-3' exonuclease
MFCGLQDADLLLLSLLCHEPYFIVMRENTEAGVSGLAGVMAEL